MIPGSEVERLGKLASQQGRFFCGQLHSHPGDAFHSLPDDQAPAVRFDGAISIVVPRFGIDGLLPADAAVFRFDVNKPGWRQWSPRRIRSSLHIEASGEPKVLGLE